MKLRNLISRTSLLICAAGIIFGIVAGWMVKVAIASSRLESMQESVQRISIIEPFNFVVRAYQTGDLEIAAWAIDDFLDQTSQYRHPGSNWRMQQAAYDVLVYGFQLDLADRMGNEDLASSATKQALAAVQFCQAPEYATIRDADSLRSFAKNWLDDFKQTSAAAGLETPE